jgi:hypothetical protein
MGGGREGATGRRPDGRERPAGIDDRHGIP